MVVHFGERSRRDSGTVLDEFVEASVRRDEVGIAHRFVLRRLGIGANASGPKLIERGIEIFDKEADRPVRIAHPARRRHGKQASVGQFEDVRVDALDSRVGQTEDITDEGPHLFAVRGGGAGEPQPDDAHALHRSQGTERICQSAPEPRAARANNAADADAPDVVSHRLADMPLIHIGESVDVSLTWRIEVPRPRVWQCITDADLLNQWLGELVSGVVGAGSNFMVNHGNDSCCRSTVVTFAEPCRLDFTWHFPDEPASNVTLELDESDAATYLRLGHSGLGDLAEPYRVGWCVHLSYLEAAALGTPLPPSMFWRLHGTMAQLNAH